MALSRTIHSTLLLVVWSIVSTTSAWGGGTPLPVIPKAKGEQCVEETSLMRSNHMDFLLHKRDETLRKGVRSPQHSLKECLGCHVPKRDERRVAYGDSEHFCSSCHQYAAVRIDCFTCHADQPGESSKSR
jgi:hypothetical protein